MAENHVMQKKVIDVIRPYFRAKIDENAIANTTKIEELGIDSARLVDIALDLENQFNIQIPDERFDQFDTIGNITLLVQAQASPASEQ